LKTDRRQARNIGFYVLILILLIATIMMMTSNNTQTTDITYSEVRQLFENEQVETFTAREDELILNLYSEYSGATTVYHELLSVDYLREDLGELIDKQYKAGIIKDYDYLEPWTAPWWVSMLPYLGLIIIMVVFWVVMLNMAKKGDGGAGGAMRFGKARVRFGVDEKKHITFADVAGCEEEKEELEEIVGFLRSPETYSQMGARIPKGVLLVGPPGTGKTLLAKAVAGEAGVQFLSISGSDFVELYVGVGASRVRDLFEQAKKVAPAIVFIDEIDAVGRQRGSGLGGGHDEREQTLNQLLVEMDGFGNNSGVIVMAATNRADILDNALLRPGRFDRTVYVGMPDKKGREAILKVHARGKPLGDDVNLSSIARGTPGFAGADLENLLNESAILAVRRGKRFITQAEINESILKVIAGPEKKSKVMSEKAKKLTAYHEAGHAIAGKFMAGKDPVEYITIIPRGPTGGMTVYRPNEDKEDYTSMGEMFADIVVALGGRTAERLMLDDISTGASGDIHSATSAARAMVTRYGFSNKLGPISFDSSDHSIFIGRDFGTTKSYSEETAAIIDEEVKRIFDEAGKKCEEILLEHKDLLIATADYLIENESMEGATFHYLCEHGELPPAADDGTVEPPAKIISYSLDSEKAPDTDEAASEAQTEASPEIPDDAPDKATPEPPAEYTGDTEDK
jgi:cell division protease FtsH